MKKEMTTICSHHDKKSGGLGEQAHLQQALKILAWYNQFLMLTLIAWMSQTGSTRRMRRQRQRKTWRRWKGRKTWRRQKGSKINLLVKR